MKKIKVILCRAAAIFIMLGCSSFNVNAEVSKQSGIPEMMQPNSVIRFTDEENYDIIEGGEYEGDYVTSVENQDKLSDVWPTPNEGTYVYYASDGRVNKIQLGNVSDTASAYSRNTVDDQHIICDGCKKPAVKEGCVIVGDYHFGSGALNSIIVRDTYTRGYGRFTNFDDETGESDNILKKGDIATSSHYDNPPYQTKITCKANGHTKKLNKADLGCLPDAVIDIWKYGTEYFGKSWEKNLTIENGSYCYYYDD